MVILQRSDAEKYKLISSFGIYFLCQITISDRLLLSIKLILFVFIYDSPAINNLTSRFFKLFKAFIKISKPLYSLMNPKNNNNNFGGFIIFNFLHASFLKHLILNFLLKVKTSYYF